MTTELGIIAPKSGGAVNRTAPPYSTPMGQCKVECKFDRCLAFTFYIEDEVSVLDKRLVAKFTSEGYISSQHTSGVHVHNRQSSSNDRTTMGKMLFSKQNIQ